MLGRKRRQFGDELFLARVGDVTESLPDCLEGQSGIDAAINKHLGPVGKICAQKVEPAEPQISRRTGRRDQEHRIFRLDASGGF